jgi:hypothetical protein
MLRTSRKLFVQFSLVLCISLVLAMAPSAANAAKTIDIGDARALPLGNTVTINLFSATSLSGLGQQRR